MIIHRQTTHRTAIVAALSTALVIAGCAGTAGGTPSVVTVTSTVQAPPGDAESLTGRAAQNPRPPDSSQRRTSADSRPAASPADRAAAMSTDDGAPTTLVTGRPALSDPGEPGATPNATDPGRTDRTEQPAAGSADDSIRHTSGSERPPGTPSLGDLFVAAARDAAAAGVAPADPDTPGPETGPACSANSDYFDEPPTGLRADVIAGWQKATKTAAAAGITLCLNDGKRSRAQQQAQFDDYAEQYGEQVAEQLVLPPNKSAHVVGIAIDVQPADGYRWLQNTAGSLGFCRMYDNEPWHFEFNPAYTHTGCPDRLPEPPR